MSDRKIINTKDNFYPDVRKPIFLYAGCTKEQVFAILNYIYFFSPNTFLIFFFQRQLIFSSSDEISDVTRRLYLFYKVLIYLF